jgi:hypothetical protein
VALLQVVESGVKDVEISAELVAFSKATVRVEEAIVLLKLMVSVTVLLATFTTVEDVGVVAEPVGEIVSMTNEEEVVVAAELSEVSTAPLIEATAFVVVAAFTEYEAAKTVELVHEAEVVEATAERTGVNETIGMVEVAITFE